MRIDGTGLNILLQVVIDSQKETSILGKFSMMRKLKSRKTPEKGVGEQNGESPGWPVFVTKLCLCNFS